MVEAVEGARVEASSRCSSTQTQQQQDGAADDDGRRRGLRLRSRSGQGWRRRRLQQVSRSDQGWRRRLPSGTSAAMSAREQLEARRRIERLLDEDRRRVAPPLEKAMTPVGWLDHKRRRCSLEGVATISSFGSVDDEAATNGRATQTDLRSEKKNNSSRRIMGYNLGSP